MSQIRFYTLRELPFDVVNRYSYKFWKTFHPTTCSVKWLQFFSQWRFRRVFHAFCYSTWNPLHFYFTIRLQFFGNFPFMSFVFCCCIYSDFFLFVCLFFDFEFIFLVLFDICYLFFFVFSSASKIDFRCLFYVRI